MICRHMIPIITFLNNIITQMLFDSSVSAESRKRSYEICFGNSKFCVCYSRLEDLQVQCEEFYSEEGRKEEVGMMKEVGGKRKEERG